MHLLSRRRFVGGVAGAAVAAACARSVLAGAGTLPSTKAAASTAPAGPIRGPREYFGVNIDAPYPAAQRGDYAKLAAALGEAGVGSVRTSIGWRYAEAVKGKFDWSQMDECLEKLPKDVEVLMLMLSTPDWASGVEVGKTVGWFDTYMPRDFDDWGNFFFEAVKRYRGRVKYWEVWNEENGIDFFHPKPDAQVYVKLLKTAHAAAKRADPDCKIVLGGLQMNGVIANPWSPVKTPNFLEDIYRAGGGPFFDICNTHPYVGKDPGASHMMELTGDTRKVMAQFGDKDKPLWITETGTAIAQGTSEADAAKLLEETYRLAAASDSGVDRVFWFTFRDFPGDVLGFESTMGMIRHDWTHKPAFEAFARLTREARLTPEGRR